MLAQLQADVSTLLDDPEALAGLSSIGLGRAAWQEGPGPEAGDAVLAARAEHATDLAGGSDQVVFVTAGRDAPATRSICATRSRRRRGRRCCGPTSARSSASSRTVVALNDWVSPNPKPEALSTSSPRGVLDPTGPTRPNPASLALLRRTSRRSSGRRAAWRHLHRRPRRDDCAGRPSSTAATSRSRGRPGPARRYRAAHLSTASSLRRQAGRHHRDEPPRHRQPARSNRRGVRRSTAISTSSTRSAKCQTCRPPASRT